MLRRFLLLLALLACAGCSILDVVGITNGTLELPLPSLSGITIPWKNTTPCTMIAASPDSGSNSAEPLSAPSRQMTSPSHASPSQAGAGSSSKCLSSSTANRAPPARLKSGRAEWVLETGIGSGTLRVPSQRIPARPLHSRPSPQPASPMRLQSFAAGRRAGSTGASRSPLASATMTKRRSGWCCSQTSTAPEGVICN